MTWERRHPCRLVSRTDAVRNCAPWWRLVLGVWSFSGSWSLVLGAYTFRPSGFGLLSDFGIRNSDFLRRSSKMNELWPWLALFGLGAYHGINPGMGWLFAVALGMQEKKRSAVLLALPPIALWHALSIGVIVLLVALAKIALN